MTVSDLRVQAAKDQRDAHEAVMVHETAEIVTLTHKNTEEIRRLAGEQAAILAAQDRMLAQQTELLTLLRGHIARPEEGRHRDVLQAIPDESANSNTMS